jgi:hypothetical protein
MLFLPQALEAIRSAGSDAQQQQQQQRRRPSVQDFSMVRLEDPSLAETSSSVVALGQQVLHAELSDILRNACLIHRCPVYTAL